VARKPAARLAPARQAAVWAANRLDADTKRPKLPGDRRLFEIPGQSDKVVAKWLNPEERDSDNLTTFNAGDILTVSRLKFLGRPGLRRSLARKRKSFTVNLLWMARVLECPRSTNLFASRECSSPSEPKLP
jgi:hypothetical protein